MGCEVLEMEVAEISSSTNPIIESGGQLTKGISILEVETPEETSALKYHLVWDTSFVQ